MTIGLHLARFVLKVVGADQLVQKVDGRALGFGILHPKVSQVGTGMTGETLASLEPGATQLTDYVLVRVHLQRCMAMKRKQKYLKCPACKVWPDRFANMLLFLVKALSTAHEYVNNCVYLKGLYWLKCFLGLVQNASRNSIFSQSDQNWMAL